MDKYGCGTKECSNKIKYYNELEECYYCKNCTICMFKEGECAKIGSLNTIKQLLTLSKSVLDELYEYVVDEHLEIKWKLALKQHKEFLCELVIINQELNEALKTGKFKDLAKIQKRAFCLKSMITENEVFLKYLLHKEMNKHRLKCQNSNSNTIISNVFDEGGKVGNEDENNLLCRNKDLKILVDPKLSTSFEDEEIKENSCEKIKYNCEDKLHSENERDKLLEKIIDVELESDSVKQNLIEVNNKSDKCDSLNDIYYSVREIYKEISGKSENIDTEFNLALNLEIEQDMSLLKALSKIKIPKINSLLLSYVPEDCDECKEFIENAIEEINEFYFNDECETNIESGQYIDSLRKVAQKTKRLFSVCCTSFTQTYFEMLISFSKHIEEIWLKGNTLSFDNECNFGENMEGCKILHLDLSWSGDETKNDKNAKLKDFENLVKGIANCSQLRASLMTICIKDCGYSTKEAQSILDKYGLDVVEVIS